MSENKYKGVAQDHQKCNFKNVGDLNIKKFRLGIFYFLFVFYIIKKNGKLGRLNTKLMGNE